MANLYNKAGLVNIPVGYRDGFLYNIKPEDNTLAFRFNRDSAATRVNKEGLIEEVGYFGPELVQNGNFEEIGSEEISNGDFSNGSTDWFNPDNAATFSNNSVTITGGSGNRRINQSNVTSPTSSQWKLQYEIIEKVGTSDLKVYTTNSGSAAYEVVPSTIGVHTYFFNTNLTTFYFNFSNSAGSITIDNVSVKEVGQNWTFGTGWSIEDGKAVAVLANNTFLQQTNQDAIADKTYKVVYTVSDYQNGNVRFQFSGGNGNTIGTSVNANGTYTEYIKSTLNHTIYRFKGASNDGGFTGSISNISVTEVKGDKPRIDYTDSLTSPSFLLEPQSTNLVTYSEDFSSWTKTGNTTISSTNVTSPSGENNATNITGLNGSGGNDLRFFPSGFNSANKTLCFSVYFKGSGTLRLQMSNGVDQGIEQSITLTDNWKRHQVSGTFNSTSSGSQFHCNIDDSSSSTATSYDVWGAQVEEKSYATSYIPTAGSTVTRAQETCNGAGNASTFNSTEGVLYAEISALADDGTGRNLGISDGTTSNRILILYSPNSNELRFYLAGSGGSITVNHTLTEVTEFIKVAVKYKAQDFSFYVNGVKISINTSNITFSGLDDISFNNPFGGGTSNFYGKTKGVYVFNEALTDDELQQLTGPEYNSFAALAAAYNYTVI